MNSLMRAGTAESNPAMSSMPASIDSIYIVKVTLWGGFVEGQLNQLVTESNALHVRLLPEADQGHGCRGHAAGQVRSRNGLSHRARHVECEAESLSSRRSIDEGLVEGLLEGVVDLRVDTPGSHRHLLEECVPDGDRVEHVGWDVLPDELIEDGLDEVQGLASKLIVKLHGRVLGLRLVSQFNPVLGSVLAFALLELPVLEVAAANGLLQVGVGQAEQITMRPALSLRIRDDLWVDLFLLGLLQHFGQITNSVASTEGQGEKQRLLLRVLHGVFLLGGIVGASRSSQNHKTTNQRLVGHLEHESARVVTHHISPSFLLLHLSGRAILGDRDDERLALLAHRQRSVDLLEVNELPPVGLQIEMVDTDGDILQQLHLIIEILGHFWMID
ncbi:hypothetical protein WR25_10051 [Diploscapter pachys]|uniref:Uncharacterized protein n=1 Tax=Diploscapter pachys TaxID=2018661 RepID=A0A2A2JAQ1_9BILA|nr:hypothetical protein WR25_10051 [Diploscapter pachys]